MKYGAAIAQFSVVAFLAMLARLFPEGSDSRTVLTAIAVAGFVGGIIGLTLREGWRKQKSTPRSQRRIMLTLVAALTGAAVMYLLHFLTTQRVAVGLGFLGLWGLLIVFSSIGALVAARTDGKNVSEHAVGG